VTPDPTETGWITSLIQSLGDLGPIPDGLTVQNKVEDNTHGPLKIRSFAAEDEAARLEALLQDLDGKISYPELLGRWRHHLVFRYLPLEPEPTDPEQNTAFQMGRFLGTLNTQPAENTTPADLDAEFSAWLDRLGRLSLLPTFTIQPLKDHYLANRPAELPVRLGYWDAMPHNFGWHGGRCLMLDEKHLRPSFPGIGLVKPSFLLSPLDWQQVRAGYASTASATTYNRDRSFLEFYYLVAALYFYSLIHVAGRISLPENPRYLSYRDRLTDLAMHNNVTAVLRSELALYQAFPNHIRFFITTRRGPLWRRIRRMMA
jgi:hypothetical protein